MHSTTIFRHKLNKQHNALSFHRVREAIAFFMLQFYHMDGKGNLAEILSKHCANSDIWTQLQPHLFWERDAVDMEPKSTCRDMQTDGECQVSTVLGQFYFT